MTTNLFETAVNKKEITDFFRGNGKYLIPSPDYEGHVHGALIGGCARTYAELSPSNMKIFNDAFIEFLKSLEVSKEDLNHLLANLSSYFSQKSRDGFVDSHLFENESDLSSGILKEYLKNIYQAPFIDEVKDQIGRHVKFTKKKGFSLLGNLTAAL